MYKNTIKSAGVGFYRISNTRVWPAYINQTLWTLFGMSKADFIYSISMDNILGGRYTQQINLNDDICEGKPICDKKGVINVTGFSDYSTQFPLKVIYVINRISEQTSLLLILIWRMTPEIISYSNIIETFNIDNLVFNELNELGFEYNKVTQTVKIKTALFCLESCWAIDTMELVNSFMRFLHPDDHACFRAAINSASEKSDYGDISIRVSVLQKDYREVKLWYSSSTDQNGNVNKIQGIIGCVSGVEQKDRFRSVNSVSHLFTDDKMLLHLVFNMDTNLRIHSENDSEISAFPCMDYQSILAAIRDVFVHKCDGLFIERLKNRYAKMQANAKVHDFYCCDVRMLSCLDKNHANQADYRWYHMIQELFFDIRANVTLGVLSVYDIQEFRSEEHKDLLPYSESNSTGMLNFDTFIIRFMEYFYTAQYNKKPLTYSALALVKITLKPKSSDIVIEAMNRAMKTICALVYKDEFNGKYAENIFAILFHAQNQPESIQERIRMLDIGLSSIQNAGYSISVAIGYCVMRDDDPNTCSLLLERANISLFWACLPNNNHVYQYTQENEECIKKTLSDAGEDASLRNVKTPPNVYIRTFGSFDIFVNDRAIPFSSEKAKELLAILVDRRGGFVTSGQAISYLWEDEPCNKKVLSRLRKVALLLKRQLEEYGIEDIIESVNGRRRLVKGHGIQCDYYDLFAGNAIEQQYYGAYMPEYSWAETTNAILEGSYNSAPENMKPKLDWLH